MMPEAETHMRREVRTIPETVERLLQAAAGPSRAAAEKLKALNPQVVTTIARGSSDHAATYLKYAIELSTGIPVSSMAPSVSSIYGVRMKLAGSATLAISQSGQSPDIVAMAETARASGSVVIAITNAEGSALAKAGEHHIDIDAGPEHSVAATKTFVASIVAGLMLLGHWREDRALLAALEKLPEECAEALRCDWTALAEDICARRDDRRSLYVIGRGPSLAIAQECALKFKETCQLHAEAYSAAEIMHGPVSIAGQGFPVLALAARDAAEMSVVEVANQLARRQVDLFLTSDLQSAARKLPFAKGGHKLTDPLVLVVSFYVFIEQLAGRLGLDPDKPPHLRKVTETR